MATTKIAILDDYQHAAMKFADWNQLPDSVQVEVFDDHIDDEAQLVQRLQPFEIVMAMRERTPFPASLLEQLPSLRLLTTTGMRNAALDLEAAAKLGIIVCGTKGGNKATMELTWALILGLLRHIPRESAAIGQGQWQVAVGSGLEGKTIGLVGLGRIGSQMARVAQAFDMPIIAWSENLTGETAASNNARRVDKQTLFRESDIVSIHLQLSDRTRGLIGTKELDAMKPAAVLINTSRGPIVDEYALAERLRQGRLAGAGIDVFEREPLPADHPFRGLDNLLLTPHVGYVTAETYNLFFGQTVENIAAYLAGEPERVMNPDVLPHRRPPPGG